MTQLTTPLPIAQYEGDFIQLLLDHQQQMTAVERFSDHHGRSPRGPAQSHYSQSHYYRDLLPATPPAEGQQYAFEVDLDACSGCKSCVVACHTLNGLDEDETWRQVGSLHADSHTEDVLFHVTAACHHCVDPGCLRGCPVLAYDKDPVTGIVRHLDDQCIGCKYCTMMCPYEVPQYRKTKGIVRKCDMCRQRLAVGEAPACVQACPNEAIRIATVDVAPLQASIEGTTTSLVPGAPPSGITVPTTLYRTNSPHLQSAIAQDREVHHVGESHWPLAVMLILTQASVGLLAAERLATLLARMDSAPLAFSVTRSALTVAFVLALAGLGLAPLHLGQPLKAWRVFLGLRTSWLSREAVVFGKYAGLLAAAVVLAWLPVYRELLPSAVTQNLPIGLLPVTQIAALVVGLGGLYASAMIYIATQRTFWCYTRTMMRFGLSAASSGCFLVLPLLAGSDPDSVILATLGLIGLACLGSKAAGEWKLHVGRGHDGGQEHRDGSESQRLDRQSRALVREHLTGLVSGRFIAAGLGAALASAAMLLTLLHALPAAVALFAAAGLAVLIGELCERLLYFCSVVHSRMPGTLA